jgi:hypothetical protein
MTDKYILLPDHTVLPEPDLLKWARWFETGDRRVALTKLERPDGEYNVSTVFLGLDHAWSPLGRYAPPLLFETMVFKQDGEWLDIQERCSTWDQAIAQHELVVDRVREGINA